MVKVGAIILAAGTASRMGEPKLLLPFGDGPLIHPTVYVALQQLQQVVCVTGAYRTQVERVLACYGDAIEIHHNVRFESGMASSLKLGIEVLQGRVDAVLIFLADQPFVQQEVIDALIEHYIQVREGGVSIVRPVYAQQPGHPILFDARLFDDFAVLSGDVGARNVIKQHKDQLAFVHFEKAEWGADIDTPHDYLTLLKKG